MTAVQNDVLKQLITHPKFATYPPALVEEAYDVMLRFAPTLATIAPIASHWLLGVLHAGYIDVMTIKVLSEAELAARDVTNNEAYSDEMFSAFCAGVEWMVHHNTSAGSDETVNDGFQRWWKRRGSNV